MNMKRKELASDDIRDEIYISPSLMTTEEDLSASESCKNVMRIVLILDRSGSMSSIKTVTINNVNKYIESQKVNSKDVKILVTLVLFDDRYELLYEDVDINSVELLNNQTFVPRGSTALYDAIGKTVNILTEKIDKTKADIQATLVVIVTDGEENASKEYTSNNIKQLIKETSLKGFEFVYLGANLNAFSSSESIGIKSTNTMQYKTESASVDKSYENLTQASYKWANRSFRGMPPMEFFDTEERDTTNVDNKINKLSNIQSTDITNDNTTMNAKMNMDLLSNLKK